MAWGKGERQRGNLRLSDVSFADWAETASLIVDEGVLLQLGRSRDGGALSIGYVHNGAKGREWYASDEDFLEGMHDLARHLGVVRSERATPAEPRPQAPGSQRARRRGQASV